MKYFIETFFYLLCIEFRLKSYRDTCFSLLISCDSPIIFDSFHASCTFGVSFTFIQKLRLTLHYKKICNENLYT